MNPALLYYIVVPFGAWLVLVPGLGNLLHFRDTLADDRAQVAGGAQLVAFWDRLSQRRYAPQPPLGVRSHRAGQGRHRATQSWPAPLSPRLHEREPGVRYVPMRGAS